MKKHYLFIIALIAFCTLTGCGSARQVSQLVREVQKDTIYLSSIQFDSIYVNHDLLTDRSRDTILIKETNTEIRYKILRDTVERVKIEIQRDSIPYEVRIETIKEVPYKRNWLDIIGYISLSILVGLLGLKLTKLIKF